MEDCCVLSIVCLTGCTSHASGWSPGTPDQRGGVVGEREGLVHSTAQLNRGRNLMRFGDCWQHERDMGLHCRHSPCKGNLGSPGLSTRSADQGWSGLQLTFQPAIAALVQKTVEAVDREESTFFLLWPLQLSSCWAQAHLVSLIYPQMLIDCIDQIQCFWGSRVHKTWPIFSTISPLTYNMEYCFLCHYKLWLCGFFESAGVRKLCDLPLWAL